VAAWLGSIPLAAYYFHILTPLSGPANVLAVPLCGLVLASDLASLLLAGWFPFAAEMFNHAGWFLMECIRVTSQWSANWPAAYFYVPTPGLFAVGLYYFILLAVFTGWLFQAGAWRRWKIAGLLALTVAWCIQWVWSGSATRLTVLPLSGGHAVFVQAPGWQNDWLIDSGNKSSVERVMTPFLRAQGVNRLPHFILSHGEISYTGGAQFIEEVFRPRNIYSSPVRFRSPEYRKFQAEPAGNLSERKFLKCGDQIGPWTVLHPDAKDQFPKAGDNALVLRGEIGGVRVLLLSDLGRSGQDALLERAPDLRADIVVSGLPTNGEPLNDALLAAIQPRVIVIVDADFPATKRANKTLQERLAAKGVPVIYTRAAEAVTLEARGGGWELRAMDGTEMKFRRELEGPQNAKRE
jgi:competence protein ComEC